MNRLVLRILFAFILSFSLFACSDSDSGGGSDVPGNGGPGGGDVNYYPTVSKVYNQAPLNFYIETSSGGAVYDFATCMSNMGIQVWEDDPEIRIQFGAFAACNTTHLNGSYIFASVPKASSLTVGSNTNLLPVLLVDSDRFYYEIDSTHFLLEETLPNGNIVTIKANAQ